MKAEKLLMSISLLVVLLLFSGCGKELEDLSSLETGSDVESPEGSGQAEGEILRLQVSDAGFIDANTGSRAIDEGLTTKFEDGDQIGLFVVNSQNKILYANVPYTKEGDVWTTKENIRTKSYPVRVFAYYPYVPDDEIIAKVDSTADNYSDFFKTYIDELDISNQSSLADYRKADVMACMVMVNDKEEAREALTLTLNHLMGLVMVKLPETVTVTEINYYLKGDENFTWKIVQDKELPANLSDVLLKGTDGTIPLKESIGYRYVCKSGKNTESFNGSFMTYETVKRYTISNSIVTAGLYKTYNVGVEPFASSRGKIEYIPQVGDFYMSNGSILPKNTSADKTGCVGIVLWTGDPTFYDPILKKDFSKCTHGLIISLTELQTPYQAKYADTSIQSWAQDQAFYDTGYLPLSNTDNMQGYNNTKILEFYNSKFKETYPVTALGVFEKIASNDDLPKGKTSTWFFPSLQGYKEWNSVCSTIDSSLTAVGGQRSQGMYGYYTSTEYNNAKAYSIAIKIGKIEPGFKQSNLSPIRLFAAF